MMDEVDPQLQLHQEQTAGGYEAGTPHTHTHTHTHTHNATPIHPRELWMCEQLPQIIPS